VYFNMNAHPSGLRQGNISECCGQVQRALPKRFKQQESTPGISPCETVDCFFWSFSNPAARPTIHSTSAAFYGGTAAPR
jgi:hypothetical protein